MVKEKISRFYEIMESNPGITYKVHVNGLCLVHKMDEMDENGTVWIGDARISRLNWEYDKAVVLEEGYPDVECEYEVVN